MNERAPGRNDTGAQQTGAGQEGITWLHLSDLHHGQEGMASLWPQRLEAALDDMRARARVLGTPDLILFTGDLAYSGKEQEYAQVDATLDRIREAVGGDPVVVPVPGNHDLSRPASTNVAARGMREYLTEPDLRSSIWEKPDAGNENLAFLRQRFTAYHAWWQRRIAHDWRRRDLSFQEGVLPGDFRLAFEKDGFRLGLMGLNSAFLHLYGGCKGKLAVEPAQVPGFVDWAPTCNAALLLMHHPYDWLHENWQQRLRREIYASKRFAACLFGHMHDGVAISESRNKQVRYWLQAASLCGLERYEDPEPGTRRCGYAWGRIERVDAEQGRLTVWRRELIETRGGDLTFDRPPGEDEEENFDVAVREVAVERSRVAVVALPQHRAVALERFAEDMTAAAELFEQGRFAAAAEAYQRIRDRIEAHELGDGDAELRRVLAQARLYVSASLLSMQDQAGAAEQAQELDAAELDAADRVVLAQVWAQLREFERARAAMDIVDTEKTAAVRQLLAIEAVFAGIEQGRPAMPSDLERVLATMDEESANIVRRVLDGDGSAITDPTVRIRACALLVMCGRHDTAARWALELIEKNEDRPGLQAAAIRSLLSALSWSTNDMPFSCHQIAKELRPRVITLLGRYLDPLQESPLAAAVPAPELAERMADFQYLVRDGIRREAACQRMREHGRDTRYFEPNFVLGPDEVKELPGLVWAPGHPWHDRFQEAARVGQAGDRERARVLIGQLAEEFPGRMPIEWLAAILWFEGGDPIQASRHARCAFDALPGTGQAMLLGDVLVSMDEHQAVWTELREHLERSPDLRGRRILATAAFYAASEKAADCWHEVVAHERATARDLMWLARSLYVTGEVAEAAEVAWQAFEHASSDSLTTAELGDCAVMQLERPAGHEAERLLALAKRFLERAQTRADDVAAHRYVNLWQVLGRPPELPGLDLAELESLGVVQRVPRAHIPALQIEEAQRWADALDAYYRGDISFGSVARRVKKPAVEIFSVLLDNHVPWTTPLLLASDAMDLTGTELLLGVPEILLLAHLELLDQLDRALGPDGRVVLFDDVLDKEILGAPAWFRSYEREDERRRLVGLRERLNAAPGVLGQERRTDEPGDEAAWCTQQGFTLVSAFEGRGAFLLDTLLQGLIERGYLAPDRAGQVGEAAPRVQAGDSWPERIALDASALDAADRRKVLSAIFLAFSNRMTITHDAREALERSIRVLETRHRAGERARRIRGWWTALHRRERTRVIPRPEINLPSGRDGLDVSEQTWCIREAVSWRRALVGAPSRRLVCADFVSAQLFDGVVPAYLLQPLDWTAERYAAVVSESRAVREQVISFAALARKLAGGRGTLDALLDLGFMDVYRAGDLLDIAARFHGGLAAPEPRRRLEAVEARAHDEKRNGCQHARRHLGALYATTIWTAWCEGEHSQREDVTAILLDRAAGVGRDGGTLGWLIYFLTSLAFYKPAASLAIEADALPLLASPAGRMWSCAARWLAAQPAWRPVCQHAFADFLMAQDNTLSRGHAGLEAIMVAAEALQDLSPDGSLIPPGSVLEALAILSAQWAVRPLSWLALSRGTEGRRAVSAEQLLVQMAARAAEGADILDEDTAWLFPVNTEGQNDGKVQYVALPPEAVLLRAAGNERWAGLVGRLVQSRGLDDGRIAIPLAILAERPEDEDARRAFAHLAVSAPWRRFRADPRSVLAWGAERLIPSLHGYKPSSLHDLRALLSEPGPLPEGMALADVIMERVVSGPWQSRDDQPALVESASETVTELVPLYVMVRLSLVEPEFGGELERAIECLLHAHEQPAARVAADVALCGYLAPDSDEETRARIAERIVEVLRGAAGAPPASSLAAFEPALLRVAAFTVWRLGGAAETARDRLWLTWRLHQWVIRQFHQVPAERRVQSMEALLWAYPDAAVLLEVAENDVLDPLRFGHGRLDHRLIGILHTLAMIRPVFLQVLGSPALESLLEELASRPYTAEEEWASRLPAPHSCLGWGDVPRTVPELARKILEALHENIEDAVSTSMDGAAHSSDQE
jgi:hypothetical protein